MGGKALVCGSFATKVIVFKDSAMRTTENNPYIEVFDRSKRDQKWSAGTHQWLVMKMPNGPEKTTRTRDEAVQLALVSADTVDSSHQWWK